MNTINVALIGYGLAGKVFHAPLISHVEGLRLCAVVSSSPAKVWQDYPGVTVWPNVDDAIRSPEIGMIVVATPNVTHFDFAYRALEAGKHVVVEKPFTVSAAEAETLAAFARQQNCVLSVFQNRRWDADFLTLRRIVAAGELGEIVDLESHYDRYRPVVQKRWKEQEGPGSGIWFDLGAHLADQVLQLFGFPEAIFADFAMQRAGAQTVDYFHVLLRYPQLRVILHGGNLVAEPARRFVVHGTKGSYIKSGMDVQEDQILRGIQPGDPEWGVDPQLGTIADRTSGTLQIRTVPNETGCYLEFYRRVRGAIAGTDANPVPPEEGVAVMRILEAACRSASERREIAAPIRLSILDGSGYNVTVRGI
jgi:predicted dehydrogenase